MTERTLFKVLQGVTLLLAAGCAVTIILLWHQGQGVNQRLNQELAAVAKIAHESHVAQCSSKGTRIRSLATAKAFLAAHPNGTPDFSRSFIVMAIQQDEQTLRALHGVHCSPTQLQN